MSELMWDEFDDRDLWDRLSPRQIQVANCLLKAYTNKEIAKELGISLRTAKAHIKWISLKCGISSNFTRGLRIRLAAMLLESKLKQENKVE